MKAIVTTTINSPTQALLKYIEIAERDDWVLYIISDLKTPHDPYWQLEADYPDRVKYFTPRYQIANYPDLSDAIGWNCIQRRNIGFIEAYQDGASIIATIDDDNIPMNNWGKNILVNKDIKVDYVIAKEQVFDPLRMTCNKNEPRYWHRGYPIQLLHKEKDYQVSEVSITPIIQANLWNGNPDIDAICRATHNPTDLILDIDKPFTANKPMPFNSQNTILHRLCFPDYFLFPHVGRMDDIWAAYYMQIEGGVKVVFAEPTVYQERNEHKIEKDLEDELLGYKYTYYITERDFHTRIREVIPKESWRAFNLYRKYFV